VTSIVHVTEFHRKDADVFACRPMMAQHASESSVEDRIKRNIYSIQRTSSQLDKNFARR